MISGSIVTVFGGMDRAKINCNRNLKILAGTLANINGAHLMVAILNFVIVKSLFSVWDLFWKQVRSCIFFAANHGLQDTRVQQSFFLRPLWRQSKYLSDSWTLIDKDCRSHQHAIFRVGAWYSAMSLLFLFSKQMLWRKQYFGLLRSRHTASGNLFPHTCQPARANKTYMPSQPTSRIFSQNRKNLQLSNITIALQWKKWNLWMGERQRWSTSKALLVALWHSLRRHHWKLSPAVITELRVTLVLARIKDSGDSS